jgi:hypothetical protein
VKVAELLEQWYDSGAKDANGRWAKFAAGDIGVDTMAKWLMASRTHKRGKAAKLKSAYGAIAQQENTSKLISSKQADALRAALKRLNENAPNDDIGHFMKQNEKRRELLNESAIDVGMDIAATLLQVTRDQLKRVEDDRIVDKVLDTGKEVQHRNVNMARGHVFVRVLKALGRLFARVETDRGNALYVAQQET